MQRINLPNDCGLYFYYKFCGTLPSNPQSIATSNLLFLIRGWGLMLVLSKNVYTILRTSTQISDNSSVVFKLLEEGVGPKVMFTSEPLIIDFCIYKLNLSKLWVSKEGCNFCQNEMKENSLNQTSPTVKFVL